MTRYLLDANVFIEAKRRYYGFDFCPAFWDWLVRENAAGHVFSIDKVADELVRGDDELSTWAADRGQGFFLREDASLLPSLGDAPTARRAVRPLIGRAAQVPVAPTSSSPSTTRTRGAVGTKSARRGASSG